jgi:hypothetical protein
MRTREKGMALKEAPSTPEQADERRAAQRLWSIEQAARG